MSPRMNLPLAVICTKRSKAPDQPENIKTWIDRKNIYFENVQNNFSLAFSKELPDVLKRGFLKLNRFMNFLY
jgi:hypothetical protein